MRQLDEDCQSQQKSFNDHTSELYSGFSSTASAAVAMLNGTGQSVPSLNRNLADVSNNNQTQDLKHKIDCYQNHKKNHSQSEQIDIPSLFLSTLRSHDQTSNMATFSNNIKQPQPPPPLDHSNFDKLDQSSTQEQTVASTNDDSKFHTNVLIQNNNCQTNYNKSSVIEEKEVSKVNENTNENDANEFRKRQNSINSSATNNTHSQLMRFALGIMLTVLSAFFFSLTTVIVKHVADVKPSEMALYRFIGILLMVFPVVIESKEQWFGPNCWWFRLWMLLRGVCGATSLFFRYSAVSYISLADTTIIVLSLPVFVFIFARIFLKEPFGRFHIAALILSLVGICFASKIEFIFGSNEETHVDDVEIEDSHFKQLIGTTFAIGAMIIGSLVYVFVRKMRKTHHSIILFNFAIIAIFEMLLVNFFTIGLRIPPTDGHTPWLIMALGMLSFYGQLLLTKAVQLEEAGVVSVVRVSSEAFFAFVLQIIFFDQVPDFYSTIGAVLVLSSVILLTVRKYIVALPDGSNLKTRFSCLTK